MTNKTKTYLGAAIIVAIGANVAALVFTDRYCALMERGAERQIKYPSDPPGHPRALDYDTRVSRHRVVKLTRISLGALNVLGLALLLGCLFYVSRHRTRQKEWPKGELGIIWRLMDGHETRTQWGIVSLLALAVAVAIVLSVLLRRGP